MMQTMRRGFFFPVMWASCVTLTTMGCEGCGEPEQVDVDAGQLDMVSPPLDLANTPDAAADLAPSPEDMQDMSVLDAGDMDRTVGCVLMERGTDQTHAVGAWEVTVNEGDGSWSVTGPGGEVRSAGAACSQDGESLYQVAMGRPRVSMAFGAWKINMDTSRLMWRAPAQSAPNISLSGMELTLSWPLDGEDDRQLSLVFSPHGQASEDLRVQLVTDWEDGVAGEMSFACGEEEAFFGLGTQVTGMDLRGGTYPLWTQEQGIHKPEDGGIFPLQNIPEAAYAPMGVLHSSSGWSALIDHDSFSEVDLCEEDASRVRTRSHRALPGWVFVAGDSPGERMKQVTRYTGRITTPARWTFAPWNDTVGGPDRVRAVASALRDNKIPSSAIWSEDWIGGELTSNGYRLSYAWEWDPETYPDLPSDIERLHGQGFAFLAYFNTFVVQTTRMWQEGIEGDYVIKGEDGEVYMMTDPGFRDATMVDLTNPMARQWLGGYLTRAAEDLGIDGWMADFTEWLPHDAVLHSGEDAWSAHNKFPLYWQELNRDVLEQVHADEEDPNNWVFWVRSGWASTQGGTGGLAPTMWGGDQNTDWGMDDGLPTVIPIGAHVGMSGVPIFGSDIAGYSWIGGGDLLSTKELFFRWTALGAFHPLMRTHQGAAKCLNWSFDRDQDTIAHFRRYASLHTLLLPYFEGLASVASETGMPITRHPYLVFPEDRGYWRDDHYVHFLGDDLMIAPVIEEGATGREVYLSEDEAWWALLGGEGGAEELATAGVVNAPVTKIPVFVRGGTILPLLGEVVDSFYGATQDGITDLEDVRGAYRVALYGSASGEAPAVTFGEEGVTVSATGVTRDWMMGASVDWSVATLEGGALLPECEGGVAMWDAAASCWRGNEVVLVISRGASVALAVGELALTASVQQGDGEPVRLKLFKGSEAFGEWRAETPLDQGLDSMAPPVCDSSKD